MQVVKTEPGRQHAPVFGLWKRRANTHAGGFYAVPVKIEARQVFAKSLADAIQAVRPRRRIGRDGFALAVKAGDMVRAGEHHPFDAVFACRFVQVVQAQNVGLQDRPKRAFDRHPTQVNNRLHALHHHIHRGGISQIGQQHFFARAGRATINAVGQAQHLAVGFQPPSEGLAQAAGRAGQQQFLVHLDAHGLSLVEKQGRFKR